MKTTGLENHKLARHRFVHALILLVAMLSADLQYNIAEAADLVPDDYRVGEVIGKFDDTSLYAIAYKFQSPRQFRAQYLELALGKLTTPSETHSFVSFGPVWQVPLYSDRISLKLGFSPTLLSGSRFGDRDMGDNFHFTSSASVEVSFGIRRALSLAVRIQHTSNGGISSTNPGMDVVGLNISYIPGN